MTIATTCPSGHRRWEGRDKQISINDNPVKAKMADSKTTSYSVDITISRFPVLELGNLLSTIKQHPVISSPFMDDQKKARCFFKHLAPA